MTATIDRRRLDAARAAGAAFLLESDGYCILKDVAPRSLLGRIETELDTDFRETPFGSGPFYGERTKRFGRLLARSTSVAELVLSPSILGLVDRVLGRHCDTVQLNVAQAIELHPGALAQYPHRDQDMWPDAAGSHEYLVNVLWPLTDFTADNGATILWPDSHGARTLERSDADDGVAAICSPGDAIVFLGSTLHAAGANRTCAPRRAIVLGYSLGWLKPYENPWLAYPPEIARSFPADLAALAGYRQHRPNLGNIEGRCPSVLLGDEAASRWGAVDALLPDQAAAVVAHAERQRTVRGATSALSEPGP